MANAHLTKPDEQTTLEDDALSSGGVGIDSDEEDVYADASHWMHSVSADGYDRAESGGKVSFTDLDLSVITDDEVIPDKGTAHTFGRKVNIALCAIAFIVMFGYLFIAGEGEQTLNAFTSFNIRYLLSLLTCVIKSLIISLSKRYFLSIITVGIFK